MHPRQDTIEADLSTDRADYAVLVTARESIMPRGTLVTEEIHY